MKKINLFFTNIKANRADITYILIEHNGQNPIGQLINENNYASVFQIFTILLLKKCNTNSWPLFLESLCGGLYFEDREAVCQNWKVKEDIYIKICLTRPTK